MLYTETSCTLNKYCENNIYICLIEINLHQVKAGTLQMKNNCSLNGKRLFLNRETKLKLLEVTLGVEIFGDRSQRISADR